MATKATARIDDWQNVGGIYLTGHITDHPHQDRFRKHWQYTSQIVKFDEEAGTCETLNTIYTLGKKRGTETTTLRDGSQS